MIYSGPELPEDIWCHIHSLMLLRDAARAACVSRAFFRSWRSHPHLMFDILNIGCPGIGRGFTSRVDPILKNHSGNGLKTLKLDFTDSYDAKASSCIDSWLRIVITAGIEELSLKMFSRKGEYNFPCSLLSDESESSIRYLRLVNCTFRPTVRLGRLRSLTTLHLCDVRITGDELGCLLSSCIALQRLELRKCSEITCLKLPFLLQQLSCLQVSECRHLRMIKSEAPSVSSFQFRGGKLKLLLGESLQLKNLNIDYSHSIIYYACKELPSSAPNLESLTIYSTYEKLTTTMAPSKFLHLKYLGISLCCTYDYLSLVSFLDAAPSLETFILKVLIPPERVECQSIFGDTSPFRRVPGYRHGKLKRVNIARFYSAKSLVELACHILENATSLECLTLESTAGHYRCGLTGSAKCYPMSNHKEIPKAILAIRTYIEGIAPPTVDLNVVKPCDRCYVI
ncbi:uncharacterized protein LOC124655607 isoform X2 [Lolium rigidum]|uniref:uncharacterized protein LOC124655607 isoform X2 n=2 Tax=Lolium rigidum TaxID=89674 RepID=UPI001F5C363D|nr:uncharacterized protein LOC124655607 isoform X2 [Lolium rigidum]